MKNSEIWLGFCGSSRDRRVSRALASSVFKEFDTYVDVFDVGVTFHELQLPSELQDAIGLDKKRAVELERDVDHVDHNVIERTQVFVLVISKSAVKSSLTI